MKNIYKAHAVPAALLFSFDELSIFGDYDAGLNENKTVCEQENEKMTAAFIFVVPWRFLGVKKVNCARAFFSYCKIGEITIITYKTNGNKGIMTKSAKNM